MRAVRLLLIAGATALVVAAPASAEGQGRAAVVGGQQWSINNAPWQAALLNSGADDPYWGRFCGGTILDSRHVITAAHCILNGGTSPDRPEELDVLVGTSVLDDQAPGSQRIRVERASFDPRFDPVTGDYDAAVLRLAWNIQNTTSTEPLPIAPPFWMYADGDGTDLAKVSGWGRTLEPGNDFPFALRAADVPVVPDGDCQKAYPGGLISASLMICAGNGTADACSGDSGGPLAGRPPGGQLSTYRLVGITSFGNVCGDPNHPGVYTEVTEPSMTAFVRSDPPSAPTTTETPLVAGSPRVGETVACQSGAWTGSPDLDYKFVKTAGAQTTTLSALSDVSSYTVRSSDVGARLRCAVHATNAGGYAEQLSVETAPVEGAAVLDAPAVQSLVDRIAPRARILSARCTRKRCTLEVRVTDEGYSAGVKGLIVRLTSTVKRSCRRKGRRTTCSVRTVKALRALRTGPGRFRIVINRPKPGSHRFSVIAVDRAGNRMLRPVTRTLTIRRRR